MVSVIYTHKFRVTVERRQSDDENVFKQVIIYPADAVPTKPYARPYIASKVYVGKSKAGAGGGASHSAKLEKKYVGNSIVCELADRADRFVFIGHIVYEFKLANGDTVDKYFSVVGNAGVAYPVLLGKTNVYFMLDRRFVPRDSLKLRTALEWQDAYGVYYYGVPKGLQKVALEMWTKTIRK